MTTWYACGDDWTHAANTIRSAATLNGLPLLVAGAVSQDFYAVRAFAREIRIREGGIVPLKIYGFNPGPDVETPTEPLECIL